MQTRTVDHGPGLLEPFLCQIWTLLKEVGRRVRAVVRRSWTLVDGLDLRGAIFAPDKVKTNICNWVCQSLIPYKGEKKCL